MKPDDTLAATSAQVAAQGLGATLRYLRESKSLSLAAVSTRLKFSSRQIEALEAEDWQVLPSGLPLRGMVKNYARMLDADVDALTSMLDAATPQASLARQALVSSRTVQPIGAMHEERSSRGGWGWLFIVLVLVLVAFFYALDRGWLPESWQIADWFKGVSNS